MVFIGSYNWARYAITISNEPSVSDPAFTCSEPNSKTRAEPAAIVRPRRRRVLTDKQRCRLISLGKQHRYVSTPRQKNLAQKNRIHLFAADFFALDWSSRNFKRRVAIKFSIRARAPGRRAQLWKIHHVPRRAGNREPHGRLPGRSSCKPRGRSHPPPRTSAANATSALTSALNGIPIHPQ